MKALTVRRLLMIPIVLLVLREATAQGSPAASMYKIVDDAAVKKYCVNEKVEEIKAASITWVPKRSELQTSYYARVNNSLVSFLTHKDYKKLVKEGWSGLTLVLVLPLLGLLVSLGFLPCAIYWVASFICGKRKDQERFEKKFDCCKKFTNYCVFILLGATFTMISIWGFQTFKCMGTLKPLSCTASVAFSEIINGCNSTKEYFAGLGGFTHLLGHLDTSMKNLMNANTTDYKSRADEIVARDNMNDTAASMINSFQNYTKTFMPSKVIGCKDNSVNTRIYLTANMTTYISPQIGNFTLDLEAVSRNIYTTAVLLKVLYENPNLKSDMLSALSSFYQNASSIQKETLQIKNQIMDNFDYDRSTKVAFTSLLIFTASIVITLLVYLVFAFINMVLKSLNWLIHFSKAIMMCTLVLGCLVCIIASVFVTISAVMYSACDLLDRSLAQPKLIKTFNLGSTVEKLIDTCFENTTNSNMINIMNETSAYPGIHRVLQLVAGFTNSSLVSKILSEPSTSISQHVEALDKMTFTKFDKVDQYEINEQSIEANLNSAQKFVGAKTGNRIELNEINCGDATSSVRENGAPFSYSYKNMDPKYCVVMPQYNITDYRLRWNNLTLSDSEIKNLNNLQNGIRNYSALISRLHGDLLDTVAGSPTKLTLKLKEDLRVASDKISEPRSLLVNPLAFIESPEVNSNYSKLFDCKIVKREILLVRYSLCSSFTETFSNQSFILNFLGPTIVLLSIMMCCQLRMIERDKNKLPAHMKTDTDPTVEMNELML